MPKQYYSHHWYNSKLLKNNLSLKLRIKL